MILAIRKPIARFMRYAFGHQYIFVLTNGGKTKLRRILNSDWNGNNYVRSECTRVQVPADRSARFGDYQAWKPAIFTEAERRAAAVVDAMNATVEDNAFQGAMRQGKTVNFSQVALDFAAFKKAMQSLPTP